MVNPINSENIWKFIKIPKNTNGCWIWSGSLNIHGYGRFSFNNKTLIAHRFVYEYLIGKIPKGLTLDHLCRIRNCVNPEHLEPVIMSENLKRGLINQNKEKTHCIHGHKFTKENTSHIIHHGRNERHCRKCGVIRTQKYNHKNKILVKVRTN